MKKLVNTAKLQRKVNKWNLRKLKSDKKLQKKLVKVIKKQNKIAKLMEGDIPKRPRGRPRKNPVDVLTVVNNGIPKKRGRPRKIVDGTNEIKGTKVITKSYDKYANSRHKYEKFTDPVVPTTLGKIVGYCPKCSGYISDLDMVKDEKFDYVCFNCNMEGKISKLLKEPNPDSIKEKPKSKREYMEGCLLVENSIPMNPHELISKKELGEISAPPANTIE